MQETATSFNPSAVHWILPTGYLCGMAQRKVEVKRWRQKKIENSECKNNFEVDKFGRENYVIWNHKDSNSIHVDPNHINSYQPIPAYLTNIISINDAAGICAIEHIFSWPAHLVHTPSLVLAPQIFTYGTAIDPQPTPHESSAESVTPK